MKYTNQGDTLPSS